MKKIKEAFKNYMEKYGFEVAAGFLVMNGNTNVTALYNMKKSA